MNFSDDFFNADPDSYLDDEKLKSKVKKCKEYVSRGQTIAFLNNIEDTIQLCLEYDFTEDGIYLTDAALEITPYSSELWHSKGIFYNNLFEFEKAYLCFDKALSLNPSDVDAMINKSIAEDNLGMSEEAIATLENALLIEPNNDEASFNLGIFYERKDDFENAIIHFHKTITLDKEYGDAWYELGFCYESNNQLSEALDAYQNFLDIEPYSASGWYNFGIVYLRLDDYMNAINCFELATAVNDEFSNAWFNCGLAYSKLNNYTKSREAFFKAFELDPIDDLIPLNIAQSYEATGEYELAKNYYLQTLQITKANIDAYVGLGNCYAKEDNRQEMLNCFSMIIKYNFVSNISEYSTEELLAQLYEVYHDIEIYSNSNLDMEDLFKLAESYFELGRWDDALLTYEKTLLTNKDKSNSYYGMALSLFMLNKNEEALELLMKAFELNTGTESLFLDEVPYFDSTKLYAYLTDSI
jgi:tetratricopeptide (TPR) repeat protein